MVKEQPEKPSPDVCWSFPADGVVPFDGAK